MKNEVLLLHSAALHMLHAGEFELSAATHQFSFLHQACNVGMPGWWPAARDLHACHLRLHCMLFGSQMPLMSSDIVLCQALCTLTHLPRCLYPQGDAMCLCDAMFLCNTMCLCDANVWCWLVGTSERMVCLEAAKGCSTSS